MSDRITSEKLEVRSKLEKILNVPEESIPDEPTTNPGTTLKSKASPEVEFKQRRERMTLREFPDLPAEKEDIDVGLILIGTLGLLTGVLLYTRN